MLVYWKILCCISTPGQLYLQPQGRGGQENPQLGREWKSMGPSSSSQQCYREEAKIPNECCSYGFRKCTGSVFGPIFSSTGNVHSQFLYIALCRVKVTIFILNRQNHVQHICDWRSTTPFSKNKIHLCFFGMLPEYSPHTSVSLALWPIIYAWPLSSKGITNIYIEPSHVAIQI